MMMILLAFPLSSSVELSYTLQGHPRTAKLRTRAFPWAFPWLRVKLEVDGPGSTVPDK